MAVNFKTAVQKINQVYARRITLEILQVNLGDICNQRCIHCHINASPQGSKIMPRRIIDDIVRFLSKKPELTLDVTGGCPELNPHFRYFIEQAKTYTQRIKVRNNLTVFFEKGMQDLARFYKRNRVKLVCSLPCYTKGNVEKQRGNGVFDKSIQALAFLNEIGYGREQGLELDLVYNPGGAFLPNNQANLEQDYKKILLAQYGIVFNRLLTITNAPINRFKQYLKAKGSFDEYMRLLMDNFNRDIAGNIMCRNLLSVAWNGILYDCDFNQALGLALRDNQGKIIEIGQLSPQQLADKEITFENHCYCCTAGAGSSCGGALQS